MNIQSLPKYCLTLPEKPHRTEAAQAHFKSHGLDDVTFFPAINGEKFGLRTIHPYTVDDKSGNFFCGPHETGIFLSHLSCWTHVMLTHDHAMIMEDDDVQFQSDWKLRSEAALRDVPIDFDWLFLGSCATGIVIKNKVKGNVWEVKYPCCTHCYVISNKGAEILVNTQRKMFGPVDLMMSIPDPLGGSIASFRQMKVYTVLPRVADQFNTVLCK